MDQPNSPSNSCALLHEKEITRVKLIESLSKSTKGHNIKLNRKIIRDPYTMNSHSHKGQMNQGI